MGISRDFFYAGFIFSIVSAIAVPSRSIALERREGDPNDPNCMSGPGWAPVLAVGASGYNNDPTYVNWCETSFGHDYTPVTGIEVWRKGDKGGDRVAGTQLPFCPFQI